MTHYWARSSFARLPWLKGKSSPSGWLCAQQRFVSAFTKLVDLYGNEEALPDYLIIADDDTYINIEHITEYLIKNPLESENQGVKDQDRYVPVPTTRAIFAVCRVRMPENSLKFSRGSLQRWMQPIYCDDISSSRTEFELAICKKYLHNSNGEYTYPFNATIAEGQYFQSGDSLNHVFHKYVHRIEYFCLHSDWFFGYIANHLNISRHVVPKGEYPVVGQGETSRWFDQVDTRRDAPENRLHSIMGSDLYSIPEGFCLYGNGDENKPTMVNETHERIMLPPGVKVDQSYKVNQQCQANTTICHYVKDSMERIHHESLKFRKIP
eukprot:scaffold502_cov327-Chaetoceros_neogracile.AAC.1